MEQRIYCIGSLVRVFFNKKVTKGVLERVVFRGEPLSKDDVLRYYRSEWKIKGSWLPIPKHLILRWQLPNSSRDRIVLRLLDNSGYMIIPVTLSGTGLRKDYKIEYCASMVGMQFV